MTSTQASMTNEQFIQAHRQDDIRHLALRSAPEGVDLKWCLQQIEGWQTAQHKLPHWAEVDGLHYPPRLSLEQCSSQQTAHYKQALVQRLLPSPADRAKMTDLTGGFGVDFSFLAAMFGEATYVERLPHLCDAARHNFPLLGLSHAQVVCTESDEAMPLQPQDLIFLDPARRDAAGRKTVAIEDCTPNLLEMQDHLLQHARFVVTKLSPMLDIHDALGKLHHVCEVHVVGVKGECKELLLVQSLHAPQASGLTYHCANLGSKPHAEGDTGPSPDEIYQYCAPIEPTIEPSNQKKPPFKGGLEGPFLYEPNACILKAGIQDSLCQMGVQKLHPCSNLFVSPSLVEGFPGRTFRIVAWTDFSKKGLKQFLRGITKANLTIRNFPSTVADLRRRLKLAEGGDIYLFATTLSDGSHVLIRCQKV